MFCTVTRELNDMHTAYLEHVDVPNMHFSITSHFFLHIFLHSRLIETSILTFSYRHGKIKLEGRAAKIESFFEIFEHKIRIK